MGHLTTVLKKFLNESLEAAWEFDKEVTAERHPLGAAIVEGAIEGIKEDLAGYAYPSIAGKYSLNAAVLGAGQELPLPLELYWRRPAPENASVLGQLHEACMDGVDAYRMSRHPLDQNGAEALGTYLGTGMGIVCTTIGKALKAGIDAYRANNPCQNNY